MTGPANAASQTAIDREAALWAGRCALGPLDGDRQKALDLWLENPVHAAAFQRMAKALHASDELESMVRAVDARATERESRTRTLVARTASAAAGVAALALAVHLADPPALLADERTATAEVRQIALDDGSTVWLDASSAMNIEFTERARTIDLVRGQIYVQAAHEARPLVVEAAGGQAVDIGTAFTVRLTRTGAEVEVAEGVVDARASGQTLRLSQGQAARWTRDTGPTSRAMTDPDLSGAWRSGRLVVHDRALSDVIADINRHRRRPYVLMDATTGRRRVSGVIRTDALDESFAALAKSQGLEMIDLGLAIWLKPVPRNFRTSRVGP